MKKTNYLKLVVNFVPIILLFLLVTYTPEFVKFSHSILGKAFAVILILFYVKLDFILGLFVCALVIFYYQTDYVESFNNMLNEGFTEKLDEEKQETGEEKEKKESSHHCQED
jgi:Na+/H+ antiporter NhaC